MRVLITGGAGFIGSHLTEALLWRGDEVVVLDDLSTGSLDNLRYVEDLSGFSFVEGSVLDASLVGRLVQSADAVVHLAAVPAHPSPGTRQRVNVEGSVNVLASAARSGRKIIVAPSSDWTEAAGAASDEELAVRLANDWGLPVSVVRFCNVVGPREPEGRERLLTRFVRAALDGEEIVVRGEGREIRSFGFIDDAVDGLVAILEHHDAGGHVFTFGSDEPVAVAELAALASEAAESHSEIVFRPHGGSAPKAVNLPDLSVAKQVLGYDVKWSVKDAARALVAYAMELPKPQPLGLTERRRPAEIVLDVATPVVVEMPEPSYPKTDQVVQTVPFRRRMDDPASTGVAQPLVTVVVPVYNEERLIAESIRRIRAQEAVGELIVVDDGSTDGTHEELERVKDLIDRLIILPHNRGKGAALREGVRYATGNLIVFQDSDLELDAADIPKLIEPILSGEADIVTGTRMHDGNRQLVSAKQWLANVAVTKFASLLYGTRQTDMATAARALPKEIWDSLELESDRFGIEAEIHAKCSRLDATAIEIPIIFRPRTKKEGKKLRLSDGLVAGKTLLRFRQWSPVPEGERRLAPPPVGATAVAGLAVVIGRERTPYQPVKWQPAVVGHEVTV